MPTVKSHRRGHEEKNRRGKRPERASSFHAVRPPSRAEQIIRPKTLPDLRSVDGFLAVERPKLTKLLLNVVIQRSLGAVQVLMSPESSVGDLIAATLWQYAKEGRRPILPSVDPTGFDLHYSQFSLESLRREEKLMSLGSRNFFLFSKSSTAAAQMAALGGKRDDEVESVERPARCHATEADERDRIGLPWLKLLDFLLAPKIS
ncbi:hypothetical protein NMG60_11015600 [Bertholletia excelsa]